MVGAIKDTMGKIYDRFVALEVEDRFKHFGTISIPSITTNSTLKTDFLFRKFLLLL